MSIFVDKPARGECYNCFESYGMICVHCGCCSDDEKVRYTSRIALHKRFLEVDQENNNTSDIEWNKAKIAEYEAKLKEIDKEDGRQ